jgi:hypothetical protein
MAFCPNCGKEVSPEAFACPNCGHPLRQPQPVPEPREPVSAAWWLLPLFLAFIGGIIGYFALKDRNHSTATHILIFGIIWTFLGIIVLVVIGAFLFGFIAGLNSATATVLP